MDAMTAAGLFGRITSISSFVGGVVRLKYLGHVIRNGAKVTMRDFVKPASPGVEYVCPTVLIIGTSMSSGKTTSGRAIVRMLSRSGLRVVGAKLTGAGRYRDMLALYDAGAAAVFDFVNGGLPSTVCPREKYDAALEVLLGLIAAARPDVVVAEAGASPLEPYNGAAAIERIKPHVRLYCALRVGPGRRRRRDPGIRIRARFRCGRRDLDGGGVQSRREADRTQGDQRPGCGVSRRVGTAARDVDRTLTAKPVYCCGRLCGNTRRT